MSCVAVQPLAPSRQANSVEGWLTHRNRRRCHSTRARGSPSPASATTCWSCCVGLPATGALRTHLPPESMHEFCSCTPSWHEHLSQTRLNSPITHHLGGSGTGALGALGPHDAQHHLSSSTNATTRDAAAEAAAATATAAAAAALPSALLRQTALPNLKRTRQVQ